MLPPLLFRFQYIFGPVTLHLKTRSPHKYVKYENEVFTLKTHQMFCVHITHEKFEIATISGHFEFVFEECSGREITHNCNAIFSESSLFKMFSVTTKSRRFQISSVYCARGLCY